MQQVSWLWKLVICFYCIKVEKLKKLIKKREISILDCRKKEDYDKGHIQGAQLMDLEKLSEFIKVTDKRKPVICYCYLGRSSREHCRRLMLAGFKKVHNLRGGYEAWVANQS